MEAKKEVTTHFTNKTGDKIFVELVITGDPDEAISKIMKSIHKNEDLVEGLGVEQLLFKGRSPMNVVNTHIQEAIGKIHSVVEDIKADLNS